MEQFHKIWKKVWHGICTGCLIWWKANKTGAIWIGKGCVIFWKKCVQLWQKYGKAPVLKAIQLSGIMTLLLTVITVAVLVYAFTVPKANPVVCYAGYAVSAYTLIVVCMKVPAIVKKIKQGLHSNAYSKKWLADAGLRAEVSLYLSCGISIFYAVFKFCAGVYFHSVWLGAMAMYYIILALMRFALIKRYRYNLKYENEREQRLFGLKSYRFCGILMFLLNLAVSGLVIQLVWQNKSYEYPGFLIYAFAAYSFYCIGIAIRNMAKHRKLQQPVLAAAKMLSFACALMSILATQTAMLTQFGNGQEQFARMMNALTGSAVCFLIFGLAIWMVRRANREIKRM